MLEKAVGVPNYTQRCAKKRSYISSSTCDYNGVSYYHPHGVVCNPSTMCLGYTHYLRITSDLIKVLSLKKGNKNSEMKILRHIRGNEPIDDHWGTKIYDSNCAFIGLGLTTCEIDLWWLLTHRASIIRQKIGGADTLVTNTIVYYDIINTQSRNIGDEQIGDYILSIIQAEMNKGLIEDKHKLLESMGVVVKKVTIKDSTQYEEAYKEIFKDIKNNGIDKQKREITIK